MRTSVQQSLPPMELNVLNSVQLQPAKASLASQCRSIGMAAVVKDALLRRYGSLKAAAIELTIDQGQLTRNLEAGTFRLGRLDALDEAAKALIGNALAAAFGRPHDPIAIARQLLHEAKQRIDEAEAMIA